MIKKYSLVVIVFLCFVLNGFGQATLPVNRTTWNSTPTGWTDSPLDSYLSTFACSGSNGAKFDTSGDVKIIYFDSAPATLTFEAKSNTANTTSILVVEESADGSTYTNVVTLTGNTALPITCATKGPYTLNSASRYVRWTFTKGTSNMTMDDVSITKAVSTNFVDYCNLQSPATGNTIVGTVFNVYAQVYEAGVTEAAGPGAGITAWIGYSTTNTNPNTAAWTWKPATFNVQSGNNDEYVANIGTLPTLASGTYYYASRFQIDGGPYRYGGYDTGGGNGFWDTTRDISGVLSVDTPDFVNLQFPGIGTIELGDSFDVYGQVYEQGVTPGAGQGANIQSEIGYRLGGAVTTNPTAAGWTWIAGAYNTSCSDCNVVAGVAQNDEYSANIGVAINTPGTYYYATRFRINGGAWIYGGILADGSAGNIWDGTTYQNGVLTVNEPPLANVVITEIMYDTPGTDDEWIEICNVSGSSQYLGNYKVKYNGTTRFTFPAATYIANGTCITVALGTDGDAIFNNVCPFTPTFGTPTSSGALANGTGPYTITLVATNNTSIIDSVAYSSADGGNGNGASLHVTNINLDNSSTSSNWQEVIDGGTGGVNSLVSSCTPVEPEIRVEGNLGTFPEIVSGDTTPQGTDNTLFAAQFIGSSQSKSYRVRNTGILNLTVASVSIGGLNPGDFTVTVTPATTITPGTFSLLEIEFSPLAAGVRRATVSIVNNDSNENPYTFDIQGNGLCSTNTYVITPISGPTGTVVTVVGTNFAGSTTARLNGILMTKTVLNSTTMEVIVPSGTTTGNIVIVNSIGCTSTVPFTVIDNQIGGCDGSVSLSDLFISEITDATAGGLSYIEIYNGTGAAKSLSGYSIGVYSNGEATPSNSVNLNAVTLANNATYLLAIGVSGSPSSSDTCPQTGGNGQLANQTSGIGGINKKDNEHDAIRLLKSGGTVVVDAFGVYMNSTWMDATIITGDRGFNFRRLNTAATLPNPTFNLAEWNVIDWVGSGAGSCNTNDYSNLGTFDFSRGVPPAVTVQPVAPISTCDLTATLSVTATEGFSGGLPLAYQWYVSAALPSATAWTPISNGGIYSGANSASLNISNTANLNNYQYYCEVRENTATCYTASNAVRLKVQTSIWDGTAWTPSAPNINRIAVLNGDYDMTTLGANRPSFSACQLIINSGFLLTIENNKFVEVENNVTVDGNINVKSKGSFVQNNNNGVVNGAVLTTPNKIVVEKMTALMNRWYEYTYWSSPVSGETAGTAFAESNANRRFWYNGANFRDSTRETGNDNATIAGQDDIDDNGDDWTLAPASMTLLPGVGYASTLSTAGFTGPNRSYQFTFEGPFNNGVITVPIYRNDIELNDNNWNFIGNPYPSAISADRFLTANTFFDLNGPGGPMAGAIFLWSQNTDPSNTTNGNEAQNFAQSDFAIINGTGQIAGGDNIMPTRFIPSGQGFFVSMANAAPSTVFSGQVKTATVTFNNTMREKANNTQFFRIGTGTTDNKLWLNLTTNNGASSQILVGYVDGATDGDDGMYYDAVKNLSTGAYSLLYSLVDNNTELKLGIQGKQPSSLTLDEVIPLGFYTSIQEPTTYKISKYDVEGEFLTTNAIYLKDNLLNITFDLSVSDYIFSSEPGEFNTRFEIVFRAQTLSVIDTEIPATGLTLIELPTGQVKFTVTNNLNITSVEIFDMLGRRIYQLTGDSPSEVYDISNLSQAAYMARVTLSNGQVITKRSVKRK